MFALEIAFTDGVSQPEMIFVRRPQAIVGSTEYAHVVVDDMRQFDYQLRIFRGLGRNFTVRPVGIRDGVTLPEILHGVYSGETAVDLGPVRFHVTALDSDLLLRDGETPDRAGVRILRQACSQRAPMFPAVVIPGNESVTISFVPDQPILIGRSNQCGVRLDASDISSRHARMGFESGSFWVEDLGSTNGTYVRDQQVSGRVTLEPGEPVILGRDIGVYGVVSEDQVRQASVALDIRQTKAAVPDSRYPVLLSVSEVARPARLVLSPGVGVQIGRDPTSDLWLGAPHVSRKHCVVQMSKTGSITVTDFSMNGVAYDRGMLASGQSVDLSQDPCVFNFGGGITMGVCFDEPQEQRYLERGGAPEAFLEPEEIARRDQIRSQSHANDDSMGLPENLSGTVVLTQQFTRVFRRLSLRGKLLMMFSVFLFFLALLFVVRLLLPVFL